MSIDVPRDGTDVKYNCAKYCLLHLLALILCVSSMPGLAADSCSLPVPPPSAAAGENHGIFFFGSS